MRRVHHLQLSARNESVWPYALGGSLATAATFILCLLIWLPKNDSAQQSGPLVLLDPFVWMFALPLVVGAASLTVGIMQRWCDPGRARALLIRASMVVVPVTAVTTMLGGFWGIPCSVVALITVLWFGRSRESCTTQR